MKITEAKDDVILEVFVKPKSKEFKIAVEADEIVIFCTEEPVKGKVNKEIIKQLGKLLHKEVELVSGSTSRQKRLLVRNTGKNELEKLLPQKQ